MKNYQDQFKSTLSEIKKNGLFKEERIINSSQQIQIKTKDFGEVLNFCSNNYLGLANDYRLINAAKQALTNIFDELTCSSNSFFVIAMIVL